MCSSLGMLVVKHEIAIASGRVTAATVKIWPEAVPSRNPRTFFSVSKRAVDFAFAIMCLPFIVVLTVALFVVNPIWNPGPVFFRQVRMGRNGKPFTMWKFRTMVCGSERVRAADAPLDEHRITSLGRLLRRSKLDELPNILNILTEAVHCASR